MATSRRKAKGAGGAFALSACAGLFASTCISLAFALGLLAGCADASLPSDLDSQASALQAEASEGGLAFRSDSKLQDHFRKHGWEVGSASADDYLAQANAVIANPDALHKLEAEDGDDVFYLEDTGEFVIVSTDGYIRTYYIADRAYYESQ